MRGRPVASLEPLAAELDEIARNGRPRPAIDFVLGLLYRGLSVDEIIKDILVPVQIEVGIRWESNQWSTADEHATTSVIDGVLGALSLEAPLPATRRGSVLVACAEGEYHTTPARMGTELLRGEGWDVTFLGGSLPADDLQRYAALAEPDVVVISCTVPLFLAGARRCFAAIDQVGLRAVAAGTAFGQDDVRARRVGASDWIGPTTDLVDVLGRQIVQAQPAPTPREVFELELAADDLGQQCLSAMGGRMPQMAAYSPAQLDSARTDVGSILSHLATSIDLGDDEIFTTFSAWLARVLEARGMAPGVLDRTFDTIAEVMASAGMQEAARLCGTRPAHVTPS